jgi:phage-related protein
MYTHIHVEDAPKPVRWVGSSLHDLRLAPENVRQEVGYALFAAQEGRTDPSAKPLKGFAGASVLEIVARERDGTWRAVYTVQFVDAIYVLHVFQKKSKRGIATPKQEIEMIKRRLAEAERDHRQRRESQ